MQLKIISYQGVRNLVPQKLSLYKGLNVFFGANGAGKSSVLEAVGFVTCGRSFRTNKLETMVSEGQNDLVVVGYDDNDTPIGISYDKKSRLRLIKINGEKVNKLSSLSAIYPTQIISPESYHLIDSGPTERRKYLDWCLFHVKHGYHSTWKSYTNILKQRNALLKSASSKTGSLSQSKTQDLQEQLKIWDEQLCATAELVNQERVSLLEELQGLLKTTVSDLSVNFCDSLKVSYYPGYTGDLKTKLKESFVYDMQSGVTKYGPHKADLRIKIDGYLAKDFLSRGQKKVLINAMFLAQTLLLKARTQKDSLFVIDDFASELDDDNQRRLLGLLLAQKNVQILISCLQQDSLKWLKKGYNSARMFHVEQGNIKPIHTTESETK